ncbi:hypothetical protein [Streptomyces wedmorensis]|uniref:hypothetical protein n=1 Tax=Streptomyces wedmorensis TaxID=43759 RepID=UPI0037B3B226
MRTALRTAIATALVAGVAVGTPALTAGAAFAADGPVAVQAGQAAPAAQAPTASTETETASTPVKPAAPAAAQNTTPARTGDGWIENWKAKPGETFVRDEVLRGGTVAKIVKAGALHYRAYLYKEGQAVGTIEAAGRSAASQDNGQFFVLNPDGTTHDWVGNVAPNKPGLYRLVDGTVLQLARKDGRYGLQLIENGKGRGYTYVNGVRVVWNFGKAVVVLEQDGQFSAYVPGSAKQAVPQPIEAAGYVRTEKLLRGYEAKIFKVGESHHRAEVSYEGRQTDTFDADHRSVAGNDNGTFFVLHADGTTDNWTGNYLPGAKPGVYKLADGTTLEIAKKNGRYGIQQLRWGTHGTGFTYLTEPRQVFGFNNATVVLEQDGGFAAYIHGSAKQAAPKPVTRDEQCTVVTTVGIGAGSEAELTMSPNGPKAELQDIGSGKVFATLDRNHPSLPQSAGIVARIDNPFSATPSLYTKVEGGVGSKGGSHAFPKLPKGCALNPVKGATSGQGTTGNTGVTANNAGQTSVIPQGGVAAGAELGTGGDSTALVAAGAGAASLAAAGLGFVVLRRRAGSRG